MTWRVSSSTVNSTHSADQPSLTDTQLSVCYVPLVIDAVVSGASSMTLAAMLERSADRESWRSHDPLTTTNSWSVDHGCHRSYGTRTPFGSQRTPIQARSVQWPPVLPLESRAGR